MVGPVESELAPIVRHAGTLGRTEDRLI